MAIINDYKLADENEIFRVHSLADVKVRNWVPADVELGFPLPGNTCR
jgi:hypothetical protein